LVGAGEEPSGVENSSLQTRAHGEGEIGGGESLTAIGRQPQSNGIKEKSAVRRIREGFAVSFDIRVRQQSTD